MRSLYFPAAAIHGNLFRGVAFFFVLACTALSDEDPGTVVIKAAIVGKAEAPHNIVALRPGVTSVTLEGTISLWQVASTGLLNSPSQVTLRLNTPYAQQFAAGILPPVIPFVTDVRSVRRSQ